MSGIISILVSMLVFSILVLVHEFGHYIVAKKSGILVEEFALGMGPVIFKKKIGETEYSIRLLPIGGFCRMLGEDYEENDGRAFNNKSTWVRMAVIFAGPLMNFIFAFVVVFFIAANATAIIFPTVTDYVEGSNAQSAGIEIGDKIVGVNGEHIGTYQDLYLVLEGSNGKELALEVQRNGSKEKVNLMPVKSTDNRWLIGFKPLVKTGLFSPQEAGYEKASFAETAVDSVYIMRYYVKSVVVGFVRLFTFNISPDEVTGPIGIVQIMGETVTQGLESSVSSAIKNLAVIAALLSTNLGVINLFPIPAMDGGRLIFLFVETLRGKPMDRNKEGFIHFLGFVLLMGFMLLIASNDIIRLIRG